MSGRCGGLIAENGKRTVSDDDGVRGGLFIPSRIKVAIDADLAVVGKTIGRHGAVDRQLAAIGRNGRAGFVREREGTRNGGLSGERDSVVDGTEVSVFCAKIDSAEGYVNEFVSFLGTNYDFSLGIAAKRKRITENLGFKRCI